ncbi:DUF4131 domain-containing protein [candidate division WOR-3 bacterium]|nr:DUF4131 domain-containing protein [candidate division WOR-3 bacterium]
MKFTIPDTGIRYAAVRELVAIATGIALSQVSVHAWWLALAPALLGIILTRWTKRFSLYLTLIAAAFVFGQSRVPQTPISRTYSTSTFKVLITEEPLITGRSTGVLLPPYSGKVSLLFKDSLSSVHYGDLLLLRTKIKPFSFPRNPVLTDYNKILFRQGYVGSATVKSGAIKIVSRNHGNPLITQLIMPARRYLFNLFNRLIGGTEGALLQAILSGEKSGLPETVCKAMSDSGTMHILAVSGLHVSIVVFSLWLLLNVLRIRGWWRFGLLTLGTLFYILVVGWRASAVRAGFMTWAALLSSPTQRRVSPISSLAVSGILLLLLDPFTLFNPGAQLSFAATAGLITIPPQLESLLKKITIPPLLKNWFIRPTLVSVVATLATAPLLLHHFFRFQPLTFLANILLVPLTTVILPLGFLLAFVNLITPAIAALFAETLRFLLQLMLLITNLFSNLKWAIVEPGKLSWFGVFYLYGLILLSLNYRKNWARTGFRLSLLAGLCFLVWKSALNNPKPQVTFLDPGRGDAVLLEDHQGRKLLIDAGIDNTDVLRDFLLCRGINRLDAVLITHPDRDHYGGLLDLEPTQKINLLLVPTLEGDSLYQTLLRRLQRSGTKIVVVGKGASLAGFGFKVDILWPDAVTKWFYSKKLIPTNPISIVSRIEQNGFRMLFTGDCEFPEVIHPANLSGTVNLLKSPHHGSRKGNKKQLFEPLKPEYVVVMGRYPTPARLESLLTTSGICYINTRAAGGLTMKIPPKISRFSVPTSNR